MSGMREGGRAKMMVVAVDFDVGEGKENGT